MSRILLVLLMFVACAVPPIPAPGTQNQELSTQYPETISHLTLREKIAQMIMVRIRGDYYHSKHWYRESLEKWLKEDGIGGVITFGGSIHGSYYNIQQFQQWAKYPLLVAADYERGLGQWMGGGTLFPSNMAVAATGDSSFAYAQGKITALEAMALGVQVNFSPVMDINNNPDNPIINFRAYSDDPEVVSKFGTAFIQGAQDHGLIACAKHFPGHGNTATDSHSSLPTIEGSREELETFELIPFKKAVESGVATFMAAYNSWNDVRCHANKYLLTDILKEELGFKGFVVSDWAAIEDIPGDYKSDIIISINAGIDMVMVPGAVKFGNESFEKFIKLFKESIDDGSIPMTRVDDAVKRILLIKKQAGLFDRPFSNQQLLSHIGSQKHREIAREAVRKSMVLLKNEDNLLPLPKNGKTIIVAGRGADNIGMQCGGWTISWQGEMGNKTAGTSILEAIQSTVDPTTSVQFTEDGNNAKGDVAIVVIGEEPYAEMEGDRIDLSLDKKDLAVIDKLKAQNIPVVVILLSGRPMIITDHLDQWDALVAAWLPGTEGHGISDVLFGDYNPTGELSFSWPKSMDQIPITKTDDHLFDFGYGLSY